MLFFFINMLISILLILLGVAFFTLMERKGLSYSQNRVGPDKNLGGGFLQPLLDALKLLTKGVLVPHQVSPMLYFFIPSFFFLLMIFTWFTFPNSNSMMSNMWGVFFFISVSGISNIAMLIIGVSSYSKFGVLGSLRSVAQGVSYEIIMSLMIFAVLTLYSSSGLPNVMIFPSILLFPFWWICVVAESNRAPFDFAEGESELISGFNIEYSGGPFVFIFLGEYGFILALSFISSKMFFSQTMLMAAIFFFFIIMTRGLFPRMRYDFLMGLCWFGLLPLILMWISVVLSIKN